MTKTSYATPAHTAGTGYRRTWKAIRPRDLRAHDGLYVNIAPTAPEDQGPSPRRRLPPRSRADACTGTPANLRTERAGRFVG